MSSTETPTAEALASLDALIERMAEAKRSGRHADYERAQYEVPDTMFLTLGLRERVTASGVRAVIEDSIRVTVPSGRRDELYQWLEQRGHLETLSKLRGEVPSEAARRKVEAAELSKLARHLLEHGLEIDMGLLGVSRAVIAKIPGE
jgi:hypothetical protein